MILEELLKGVSCLHLAGNLNVSVEGLSYDSRKVGKGHLFVAIRGDNFDGNDFIPQAIERGAVAIVSEQKAIPIGSKLSWAIVDNARRALAIISGNFYNQPSRRLYLIGVTGTNGKTTVTYLVESIFQQGGRKIGRLGTIDYRVGERLVEAERTTPEAPDINRYMAEMVENDCQACVMEVSSHSLDMERVYGCDFDVAVFTNLTRDHLDFHLSMERYFSSKRKLFEYLENKKEAVAVINLDDPKGKELSRGLKVRSITYGWQPSADITVDSYQLSLQGLQATITTPEGKLQVSSPLIGRANLSNILAAVGVGMAAGITPSAISQGIARVSPIPGRFEQVNEGQDFTVIVDYAHTDDALRNLLESVREVAKGRVITVFGCGGDRDPSKRPLMGAHAMKLSDIAIVTSDNPRSEDPLQIIREIEVGIESVGVRKGAHLVIPDRKEAIKRAIDEAHPGDMVVIAGKGHERYQIIGNKTIPFDDREVARQLISRKKGS
ncbi:MAG: UDP-N-acetylmuramoyl-L-alanyl-D-glutamate--2,6-diaminopimelate ligase [Candidatus Aminicenantes bacterium]|nr:UDP-N-acetylmuramoyl-L-alanyl-D-glutamate--2,6-diaminopimelate ligase [Candidatus Aminicenantes bacterium]